MYRGDIINYIDLTVEEGQNLQRGMNFNLAGKDYGVILMSVRENAPYADRIENDGTVIIYEGHDVQKNFAPKGVDVKTIDQPLTTPSGTLTQNGLFCTSVMQHKEKGKPAKIIKVYEKIKSGIWAYGGYFSLVDAWIEESNSRKVFKFKLEMLENHDGNKTNTSVNELELEHNRLIPTSVKVAVYNRDKGCCVKCGSKVNLHYDHILPFSKGGSSIDPNNIQLLCAKCNLKKHDRIE